MKKLGYLLSVSAFVWNLFSCRHSPTIPETPVVSYKKDIQPIVIANCATSGCHDSIDGEDPVLETYSDVMKIVTCGDAHSSELYQVITGKGLATVMPPASSAQGPLTDTQIKEIYLWIMQGAKNN